MSRLIRKHEHIINALRVAEKHDAAGFDDVTFVHNALPEVSGHNVSLETEIFGKKLQAPLVINAITGGGKVSAKINEGLAICARETGLAMAVGSQTVAFEYPECAESFRIARIIYPGGLLIANVGAHVKPDTAMKAVDMIAADALQVHLNAPQEMAMDEGDRDFSGWLRNIAAVVRKSKVPVIVKEVGFGLSLDTVRRLYEVGVRHFDTGGRGGTNFIAIEGMRSQQRVNPLVSWGIPTASSLVEINSCCLAETIIATGGINDGFEAAKALALGADAAGIAGTALKVLFDRDVGGLINRLENIKASLKKIMQLVGVKKPADLKTVPVVITGKTREWLTERGVDTTRYARRGR